MEQPFNIRMTCALSLRRPMQTRYDCTRGVKGQTKTASITGNARGPGSMSELSKRLTIKQAQHSRTRPAAQPTQ